VEGFLLRGQSPEGYRQRSSSPLILYLYLFFVRSHCICPSTSQTLNSSRVSEVFPSTFKEAIVRLILMKADSDLDILSNYWPISLHIFLVKNLKKVVAKQETTHLEKISLSPRFQSGFRSFQSQNCRCQVKLTTSFFLVLMPVESD